LAFTLHWLPNFNFNVEECDADGLHYETLAICRSLAPAQTLQPEATGAAVEVTKPIRHVIRPVLLNEAASRESRKDHTCHDYSIVKTAAALHSLERFPIPRNLGLPAESRIAQGQAWPAAAVPNISNRSWFIDTIRIQV